jgi:hypothetical protein
MMKAEDPLTLELTAGDVQAIIAALSELPYRVAAPILDRIRKQVLNIDPDAFTPPHANGGDNVPNRQP